MPRRGSILLSTANEIGSALVNKLGGSGYAPVEWDKKINIMGIASEDIPDALDNLIPSEGGGDRGSILISKANEIGAVLNKKFQTERGFKPKEWASAISKLTPLQVKMASGAIASFPDGAEAVPLTSLICDINPKQDLHGYSKPWAPGAGKNKFQNDGFFPKSDSVQSYYYMEFTKDTNTMPEITLVADTTYTLSFDITSSVTPFRISVGCGDGRYLLDISNKSDLNNGRVSITFTPTATQLASGAILAFRAPRYQTQQSFDYTISNVQLEISSTATSYEPYSNICPISGSTQTTVYHTGKNLLMLADADYTNTLNNVAIDYDAETQLFSLSGVNQGSSAYVLANFQNSSLKNVAMKNATYTFSHNLPTGAYAQITYRKINSSSVGTLCYIAGNGTQRSVTFALPADYDYTVNAQIGISATAGDVTASNLYMQIEVGSSASSFEAFKQKTPVVAQFGETIYGGYVDIVTGILTVTHTQLILNSDSLSIINRVNANKYRIYNSNCGAKITGSDYADLICDKLKSQTGSTNDDRCYINASGDIRLNFSKEYASDAEMIADVGSIQLVFPIETPIEIDLNNPQEVESYLGYNNIYNNTGDTSASYYADIDLDNA